MRNSSRSNIKFVNYIQDNVHGLIGLTEIENRIERTPVFKRLQDISQLGLVKRVFPGAVHNRYIHSLGVMHVIDQMALHLNRFTDSERQLLRLAAMLHDLGHYPLSHDLEQVYLRPDASAEGDSVKKIFFDNLCDKFGELENEIALLDVDLDRLDPLNSEHQKTASGLKPRKYMVEHKNYHHEIITAEVIKQNDHIRTIIRSAVDEGYFDEEHSTFEHGQEDAFVQAIILQICALITGNGDYRGVCAYPRYFTAMLQMLHSEIDADRIDYLLRDAAFSGAAYGSFDVGSLLKYLDMREYIPQSFGKAKYPHDIWIVGIKERGVSNADQFMLNRFLAYNEVIYNRYTSIIGSMIREVASMMIETANTTISIYSKEYLDKIIKEQNTSILYYTFTDSYFLQRLGLIRPEEAAHVPGLQQFVKKLNDYIALDIKKINGIPCEDIFTGSLRKYRDHINNSDIYETLRTFIKDEAYRVRNSLFLLSEKPITNHIPIDVFNRNLDIHFRFHPVVDTEENEVANRELFLVDRLMDGLAVLPNQNAESNAPVLLVDTPQSIMKEIYDVRHIMVREYMFDDSDAVTLPQL